MALMAADKRLNLVRRQAKRICKVRIFNLLVSNRSTHLHTYMSYVDDVVIFVCSLKVAVIKNGK